MSILGFRISEISYSKSSSTSIGGGGQRLNPVRNCVRSFRFELGDVEHRMYCPELVWESESERSASYLSDDLKRA